jgi:hypothetical protein
MDPALALIISIFVILFLIRMNIPISVSIFLGAFLLGVFTIGQEIFYRMFITATSLSTIRLITLVIAAFTLGYSMEYFKLLEELTSAASRMLGKFSVLLLPMIVGFLPMPGGALISAVMLKNPAKKFNLSPERTTYINYWWRHFWIAVWPLYPSFIIAAAIVEINYTDFIFATYPITLSAIISGIIFTRIGENGKIAIDVRGILTVVRSMYPILLVAFLALLLKIDLLITLFFSIVLLYIQRKIKIDDFIQIIKKTLDVKIILLVFAVMVYKDLIIFTKAAEVFFGHLNTYNFPPALAAFLLSFIVGFATGIELSFASVAMPMLIMFTGTSTSLIPQNLMLVFGAGFLGVMISPMHLCLAFTAEYFNAKLSIVYKRLIPTVLLSIVIILLFFISGSF